MISPLLSECTQAWDYSSVGFSNVLTPEEACKKIEIIQTKEKGMTVLKALRHEKLVEIDISCNTHYYLTPKGLQERAKYPIHFTPEQPAATSLKTSPEEWNDFRRLCGYYRDCIQYMEKPQQYLHLNDINKTIFMPKTFPYNWLTSLEENESETLDIAYERSKQGYVVNTLLAADEDADDLFLGYPLIGNVDTHGDLYFNPMGLLPVSIVKTPKPGKAIGNTIQVRIDKRNAYINPIWMERYIPPERRQPLESQAYRLSDEKHSGFLDLAKALPFLFSEGHYDHEVEYDPNCLNQSLPKVPKQQTFLCNTAVIFLSTSTRYSRNLIRELTFIKDNATNEDLDQTALSYIFRKHPFPNTPDDAHYRIPLQFLPFNEEQYKALEFGLNKPITKVQGPPGTGKSQLAVNLIANSVFYGESVLFTSANHEALHAIYDRTSQIMQEKDQPSVDLVQFCADMDGNFTNNWFDNSLDTIIANSNAVLEQLHEAANQDMSVIKNAVEDVLSIETKFRPWDMAYRAYVKSEQDLLIQEQILRGALFEPNLQKELSAFDFKTLLAKGQILETHTKNSLFWRLFCKRRFEKNKLKATTWLQSSFPQLYHQTIGLDAPQKLFEHLATLSEHLPQWEQARKKNQELAEKIKQLPHWEDTKPVLDQAMQTLKQSAKLALLVTYATRIKDITDNNLYFQVTSMRAIFAHKENKLIEDDALAKKMARPDKSPVLALLPAIKAFQKMEPAWATTLLSLRRAYPMLPGIIDQVIIDEAAQCNPAAIIPALYRAKRATIIGDDKQFSPIISLKDPTNAFLWKQNGMKDEELIWDFLSISGYDAVKVNDPEQPIMLRGHFRSATEISEYCSDAFYGGQLRNQTDLAHLRFPSNMGFRHAITWIDVPDNVSQEVQTAVDHVEKLVKGEYQGSIGVISPTRQVVDLLQDALQKRGLLDAVKCDTAYKFQGGECDTIILVLGYTSQMSRGKIWYIEEHPDILNVSVSRARALLIVIGDKNRCLASTKQSIKLLAQFPKAARKQHVGFDSPWEQKLYEALKDAGIETQSQYPLAGRFLDLAYDSETLKIDIEVDGAHYHLNDKGYRKMDDYFRDAQVSGMGWKIIRFWVEDLRNDMPKCVYRVQKMIQNQKD